jgi:diguanylate cyclase (GGDEF)-like protein/putative nucleotidyltransferase with HDIG domain
MAMRKNHEGPPVASENGQPAAMTSQAKAFIALVILTGIGALAAGFLHPSWPDWAKFACYALAVIFASGFKVALPGINGTMSANLIVILISVVELSPAETLALGCIAAVVQTWWNKKRVAPVHVFFNLAQIAISIQLCYVVYHDSAKLLGEQVPLRLMATAITYFLANTVPVAAVVSFTEQRPFSRTWAKCYFWSFPNYLVGAAVAWLITWSNAHLGWQASALMIPVIYVMYRSYRLYLGKLEDQKNHVEQMAALHLRTIEALALAIDAKDHTTHEHLQRVRVFALELGKEMGLTAEEQEALRAAALLHDIGKLAVPEHIINKPGRLSPEEFEKMKIHPVVGGEILERVNFPYPVVPIVRAHHEKWDGSGYPDGLKGEEIPIGARILAAVDCLDALSSDRQYRRAMPLDAAMQQVVSEAGKQFDPRVVEILQRRYTDLERLAKSGPTSADSLKLSKEIKVVHGAAPAAGFETARKSNSSQGDFLTSIVAARYEAQALLEFSIDLGRSLSLDETLSVVAARLRKLVPYDAIAIYLAREGKLIPEFVTGDDYRIFSALEIPIGEGLSGWVAQNRKPIVNGNPSVEPGYLNDPHKASSMSSALAVPLVGADDRVLGVLALYKLEADAFSNDHLRILLAILEKIGASIENAVKYQAASDSATTDYLTGLPNARSLFLQLDAEIARCKRERRGLAVILCDLDGFKRINDEFGHLAGNQVLEAFAGSLKLACREYDYVSRMGGDEFVILAPGLKREGVQEICARIHNVAANRCKEFCGGGAMSASVGVAFYPDDTDDAAQLLVEADKRMYAMKKDRQRAGSLLTMPVHTLAMQ